jgi:hypothetical protein
MSTDWYCRIGDTEYGPVTGHEIRQMAQSGRLTRDDLVRNSLTGRWVTAAHVRGLFDGTGTRLPRRRDETAPIQKRYLRLPMATMLVIVFSVALLVGIGAWYLLSRHRVVESEPGLPRELCCLTGHEDVVRSVWNGIKISGSA